MFDGAPATTEAFARIRSSAIGQRVFAAAKDVVQVKRVDLQPRFRRDELVDRRRIDLEDLRFDEGQVGADVGADLRDFLLHALVGADPGVLVGHHAGVDRDPWRSLSRCGCQAPARRRASALTIRASP